MSSVSAEPVDPVTGTATVADTRLRQHIVTFFTGGVLTATRIVTGFVRVKYLAVVLGTAGVGFLSQAAQTQLLLVSLGSLAMARGMITRMGVFAASGEPEREARLLSTALTVQLVTSVLLVVGAHLLSAPLIAWLFPGEADLATGYFSWVLLSVPLSVVATGYAEGVLYGAHRFDLYVRASMVTAVLGAALTVGAVYAWGLAGGVFGILATSLIHCVAALGYALKVRSPRQLFALGFDRAEAAALIKFSFVMLTIAAASYISRLWIQSGVIGALGVEANGLLHVPLALTSYYTPLISNPVWGRLHPSVSRSGDTTEGRAELAVGLTFTAVVTTFVVVSILALKEIPVQVAYSSAFLPAAQLLPAQLLGDFFYFVALTFGVYTLGVGYLRSYLAAWVGYYVLSAVAATLLIPSLGLQSVPVGYGVAAVALAVGYMGWFWVQGAGRDGRRALLVVGGCGAIVLVQAILAYTNTYLLVRLGIAALTASACVVLLMMRRQRLQLRRS
jgi:O-antigen/teichoic acid export membrane protein